jgi:PEP-CTERM/exosortase A-associated glycosyltransferase
MTTNGPPLKILHILNHSLPLLTGYALRSHNILRAQQSMGWQPVALTSPVDDTSWPDSSGPVEIDGVRYYRTGSVSPRMPLVQAGRRMWVLARRLREVIEFERPDLLHVHSPVLNGIPALRIGRKVGVPVVYEIRSLWEEAAVAHGTYRAHSWQYKLMRTLETRACQKADHVAVISRGLRDEFVARGIPAGNLTVVSNGVDIDQFRAMAPDAGYEKTWTLDGKRVIGFIGSFSRYEGLDVLVDAMARLTTTRTDVVLLLVGGGRMQAHLKAQVDRLHLADRVIMPGRIPRDRIPSVYSVVDVLVYPRYSLRLTELVTPLKPLEAMAMAKALVASDVGGHRELIRHGHTGLLVPAGDASALAATLAGLLDNESLRRTLGRQAQDWVRQQHSWSKTTAVYSDIYARALRSRPVQGHQGSTRRAPAAESPSSAPRT